MKSLSLTTQREELKARGVSGEDIDLALRLKEIVEQLDAAIFPDAPARVRIHHASQGGFRAMYTHPRSGGGDYYTIFAKGLRKGLNQERSDGPLMVIKKNGGIKILERDRPFSSLMPPLVALACHEVRHRMQFRRKVKYFAQQLRWDEPTELLRLSALYVERLIAVVKEGSRPSRPKQRKRAKEIASRPEVDAMIIETMALHSFRPRNWLRAVVPILLLGTKEVDE